MTKPIEYPATTEERERSEREQTGFVVKWRPGPDERVVGKCEQQPDGAWRAEARLTGICTILVARRTGLPSADEGYAWLQSLDLVTEWPRTRKAVPA